MANAVERCHVIRTYGVADFDLQEALAEIFVSMEKSWPGASFKNFAVFTEPVVGEDAFRVDLIFDVVS